MHGPRFRRQRLVLEIPPPDGGPRRARDIRRLARSGAEDWPARRAAKRRLQNAGRAGLLSDFPPRQQSTQRRPRVSGAAAAGSAAARVLLVLLDLSEE